MRNKKVSLLFSGAVLENQLEAQMAEYHRPLEAREIRHITPQHVRDVVKSQLDDGKLDSLFEEYARDHIEPVTNPKRNRRRRRSANHPAHILR
jgi:hypothetical protein